MHVFKTISCILVIVSLFVFAGCKKTEEPIVPSNDQTTAPPVPADEVPPLPPMPEGNVPAPDTNQPVAE